MDYLIRVLSDHSGIVQWVIHPAMTDRKRPVGVDDDTWAKQKLDQTIAKHPEWAHLTARDYRLSELPEPPEQRKFQHAKLGKAWKDTGAGLTVDLPAACECWKNRIRDARKRELPKLDGEWMREQASGRTEQAALIEAKRQALRDAPQQVDRTNPKTVEELKTLWPVELERP